MSKAPRYAKRTDDNQQAIVDAAIAEGASVKVLHKPLDLLIGFMGWNLLWEVKNPKRMNRSRRSADTDDQRNFYRDWKGGSSKVETPDQARTILRTLKRHGTVGQRRASHPETD